MMETTPPVVPTRALLTHTLRHTQWHSLTARSLCDERTDVWQQVAGPSSESPHHQIPQPQITENT